MHNKFWHKKSLEGWVEGEWVEPPFYVMRSLWQTHVKKILSLFGMDSFRKWLLVTRYLVFFTLYPINLLRIILVKDTCACTPKKAHRPPVHCSLSLNFLSKHSFLSSSLDLEGFSFRLVLTSALSNFYSFVLWVKRKHSAVPLLNSIAHTHTLFLSLSPGNSH